MKKILIGIAICTLMILSTVVPVSSTAVSKTTSSSLVKGNTLYVGGSGPGNYTKIQDAINDSSSGDTIYVFQGTYHEALTIDVENLKLIGEGRDVTIINANWTKTAVVIDESYVTLQGFTIRGDQNGIDVGPYLTTITISDTNITENFNGIYFAYDWDVNRIVVENSIFYSNTIGIYLISWYETGVNTIRNNTFINNIYGMVLGGKNNRIQNNTFLKNRGNGMSLFGESSIVEGNIFKENSPGLELGGSDHTITGNIFIENNVGLVADGSDHQITGNLFENNSLGVFVDTAFNTIVNQNNFIQNEKHAKFAEVNRSHGNNWDNNYWDGSSSLLGFKAIFGKMETRIKKLLQFDPYGTAYYWMPWINFDKDPAKEPYELPIRG
jgi:nitrous oxidase accessory protein